MNWPTREHARRADPLEVASRDKMRYLKAAYILAGGDRVKVRKAIEQADDTTLREVRSPGAALGVPPSILDVGFKYENGVHTPTVLVGFAPNDWDARDGFVRSLGVRRTDKPVTGERES